MIRLPSTGQIRTTEFSGFCVSHLVVRVPNVLGVRYRSKQFIWHINLKRMIVLRYARSVAVYSSHYAAFVSDSPSLDR